MTLGLLIVLGIALAGLGGELFVRGTVGFAVRARIAPGVVGATVAAFATSGPELAVAVTSASAGVPEIALGDALGSNVVNIGLVLGVVLALAGARPRRADLSRDLPVALIAPLATLGLAMDGELSRLDGAVLLASFLAWLAVTVRQAVRDRDATGELLAERRVARIVRDVTLGLVMLVVAGRVIVEAGRGVGAALGWDTFTVGAVLVAVGTSAPEMATTATARLRGHDEVAVGTVLGSNIFNGLLIVGVAAVLRPIGVVPSEIAVAVAAGVLTLLLVLPGRHDRLSRGRGVALLAVYAAYVTLLLLRH